MLCRWCKRPGLAAGPDRLALSPLSSQLVLLTVDMLRWSMLMVGAYDADTTLSDLAASSAKARRLTGVTPAATAGRGLGGVIVIGSWSE